MLRPGRRHPGRTGRLPVAWAGAALGVAAALEIPALLVIGRLSRRVSAPWLLASGCAAGIVYYTAMAYAQGPLMLLSLQVLNAWFFAAVAGVGLTLFQELIPRPGLASGLYVNTRRVGAIVAGPIISLGSVTSFGYSGVFLGCAVLTVVALLMLGFLGRSSARPTFTGRTGPPIDTPHPAGHIVRPTSEHPRSEAGVPGSGAGAEDLGQD
jgi:SET family sugar efflux transporter-like MFS transporter